MGTQVQSQGAWERGLTINFNTVNQFCAFTNNGSVALKASEEDAKEIFGVAGTIANWEVYVSANTIATSASTLEIRINAVTGNQSISIPAGSSGLWRAVSGNPDTVAANDLVSVRVNTPNTSGSLTITNCRYSFTATGTTTVHYRCNTWAYSNNAATRYACINGNIATTAEVLTTMSSAGTLVGLHVYCGANARGGVSDVITVRKNSADTAMTVTVTAANTKYSDTVDTVSIAAGDDISIKLVTGASASTAQISIVLEFQPSSTTYDLPGNWGQSLSTSTTNYAQIAGTQRSYTTEASGSNKMIAAGQASNARINVSSPNGITANSTYRLRLNNTSNGNISISIPSSTSGKLTDLVNSDIFNAGDTLGYSLVTGGTGTTINILTSTIAISLPRERPSKLSYLGVA